jgi:hypothetical protein
MTFEATIKEGGIDVLDTPLPRLSNLYILSLRVEARDDNEKEIS